ncbi:MAG: hypothetical protein V3W22_07235 [Thermoplasmata archaeon]
MAAEGSYAGYFVFREWALSFLRPRYLSLMIHTFIAFYAALKFIFLVFNSTSILEMWVFELTPAFLLAFQPLQLALVSGVAAGANAFLHFSQRKRERILAIFLTVSMIVSIILGLRTSPYYFDSVNLGRLVAIGFLLVTVPLDNIDLHGLAVPRPAAAPASPELWGPEAPEEFDQVMDSVDHVLDSLDSSKPPTAAQEQAVEPAIDILEDLISTISQQPEAEAEEEVVGLDPAEIERRKSLFEYRIKEVDRRLVSDPNDVDALFAKATYLAMKLQYDEASEILDDVTRLSPYYPGVWHLKSKVYELMGNQDMADLCAKRALEME